MPDRVLSLAIIVTLLAAGAFVYASYPQPGKQETSSSQGVPPDQIVSGGPPPDGIPSIDNPKFVNAANASTWLSDDYDSVIGIDLNGDVRAYPLQILVWHEIANDVVGGVPVAITYCPLCYATQAFVRQLNGTTVTFGTSGKLYNNNLVMYDRLTGSLWSQFWGQAIAGKLTGSALQRVPIDVTTWGAWKKLHPDTLVLSRQTGFDRDYSDDPYGTYYFEPGLLFPLSHTDGRLPQKAVVLGISIGGDSRAYELTNPFIRNGAPYYLANSTAPLLTDSLGGRPIVVWQYDGMVRFFSPMAKGITLSFSISNGTIVDDQTHSSWNFDGVALSGPLKGESLTRYVSETGFWFSWAAFYPATSIFPER